jgi:hypothetical protein
MMLEEGNMAAVIAWEEANDLHSINHRDLLFQLEGNT